MRAALLAVDCEGGLVGGGLRAALLVGGLRGRPCWWWTVRAALLVVD